MDMWKGEKLHGPDRRITRAQLAESDRIPTAPRRSVVRRLPVQHGRSGSFTYKPAGVALSGGRRCWRCLG